MQNINKTQCFLKRDNWMTVCWVPQNEAIVNKVVKIGKDLWTIAEVYDTIELSEWQRIEKTQREFEKLLH